MKGPVLVDTVVLSLRILRNARRNPLLEFMGKNIFWDIKSAREGKTVTCENDFHSMGPGHFSHHESTDTIDIRKRSFTMPHGILEFGYNRLLIHGDWMEINTKPFSSSLCDVYESLVTI